MKSRFGADMAPSWTDLVPSGGLWAASLIQVGTKMASQSDPSRRTHALLHRSSPRAPQVGKVLRWFPVERSNFRSNVRNPEKRSNSEKRVIRKFRWYFEFLVERSKSRKTFKFRKAGHPKISVVLGISGRTFKWIIQDHIQNHIETYQIHIKSNQFHIKIHIQIHIQIHSLRSYLTMSWQFSPTAPTCTATRYPHVRHVYRPGLMCAWAKYAWTHMGLGPHHDGAPLVRTAKPL